MNLQVCVKIYETFVVHIYLIESSHNYNLIQYIVYYLKMYSDQRTLHLKERKVYDQMLESDNDFQHEEQQISQAHPLLKLEIELENGNKVYINPHPHDEPVRLATEFCEEHNLDTDMIDILAESIKRSITHSHERKQQFFPQQISHKQKRKVNYTSQSCKTNNGLRSPQYFSKKFSVNSSLSLYQKGLMLQDAKKHWIARQNEHKIIEETRECTHKPKINKLSRSLITQRQALKEKKNHEDYSHEKIQNSNKISSKNISSMRSSIQIKSNQSDAGLHEQKNDSNISKSNSSVFMKLYENRKPDQISRSKIISEMLKQQTHHPIINGISKEIVGNANFKERLLRYQKQKNDKCSKLKRKEQAQQQNLYKPKTGVPPQNRNVEGLPIGDFLYGKKKKTPIIKRQDQQPHINQTSKALYDKRKATAFRRIFDHLTNRKSDKIGWQSIDINKIDPELLLIIHPLIQELQILQIELNLQDFKTALNFLFGTLSPTDKGKILNFKAETKITKDTPKRQTVEMNRNSEMIAQSIGRPKFSIYDFCQIKQNIKSQKIEQQRIEKQKRQMKECTFQPKIERRSIYY